MACFYGRRIGRLQLLGKELGYKYIIGRGILSHFETIGDIKDEDRTINTRGILLGNRQYPE
jgi:hypothetical protein